MIADSPASFLELHGGIGTIAVSTPMEFENEQIANDPRTGRYFQIS